MRGRIMSFTIKPEMIDNAIRDWPRYAQNYKGKGLVQMYFMVDRKTFAARSVTVWDSQDSIDKAEGRINSDLKEQFSNFDQYYADKPEWLYFDVEASLAG